MFGRFAIAALAATLITTPAFAQGRGNQEAGGAPPRRTFCGDACVHEWKIRSSPWYVRREVKKRDKGICKLCGFNVVKAHREWTRSKPPASDRAARKAWRAARPKWEADHIVPVADGGGECGLENYRLLCRPCHVQVTLTWRARRREAAPGKTGTLNLTLSC